MPSGPSPAVGISRPPLKGQRVLQEGNGRVGVWVTMSCGSSLQPLACPGQSELQRQYSLVKLAVQLKGIAFRVKLHYSLAV